MQRVDAFMVFWLGMVTVFGLVSLTFGFYELRRGSARWGWRGDPIARTDEPFYYWMIIAGRFAGFVVACFMFWFGSGMMDGMQ